MSVLLHLIIASIVFLSLILSGGLALDSPFLWLIVGLVFGLGLIASLTVFKLTNQPTKDLVAAIIHISGEPTETVAPNPNDEQYVKSGLSLALQKLYEISSTNPMAEKNDKEVTGGVNKPEASVQTSSDPLKAALNAAICGFVVMDGSHKITYYNTPAPINIDQNSVASLSLMFNGSDTLEKWLTECEQNAVHAEHIWTRIPDRLPDQEGRRLFDVIASYDKGAKHEVVLTLVDRTSIYLSSEEDLDFIAFAAHELRGPITVIRGYLDVLEDELSDKLAADQHELFKRLTVSSNRLSGYVNNILNTSRYDRRHLKIRLTEDSIAAVYDIVRDDMDLRAKTQGRALSVNIPTNIPTIAADKASLSEVFSNLIDNAIKYSSEGGAINVSAAANGDFVNVSVQDFGIGMPGNVVSNLFQKFYRSHRSREAIAGTGIGLYISKAIVESHGGKIQVSSEEGKGSVFTISLPIYATVADKLAGSANNNEGLIEHGNGWIKNHNMYRG